MPKRDRSGAQRNGTGRHFSRRAVLAGAGVALCTPSTDWAAAVPLRVGVPATFPLGSERLDAAALGLCGRPALVVPFDGWGVLGDHAAAGGLGLIDAALLPASETTEIVVQLERPPVLWIRGGTPRRIGVPLRHPATDAALRRMLAADLRIVPLPLSALWPNLAAGLIDGAVLLDEDAARLRALGVTRVALPPAQARLLLPPLSLQLVGVGA